MDTVTIQRQYNQINGTVELVAQGDMDQEQALDLFERGFKELFQPSCNGLIVDLSATHILNNFSLFQIYKLINLFHDLPEEEKGNKQIEVLYNGSDRNLEFLEKTVLKEGIRLHFSTKCPTRIQ